MQSGFTLVEMLAVIVVFASIGTIVLSTIYISLRSSKKSDSITTIRQNGSFALSQMVKGIRYAKALDNPYPCTPLPTPSPTPTYTTITVTNLDDTETTFACASGDSSAVTQNGQELVDTSTVSVQSCTFTCSQDSVDTPPSIDISFTLVPKNGSGLSEVSSAIPFETSVTLRNVNQ